MGQYAYFNLFVSKLSRLSLPPEDYREYAVASEPVSLLACKGLLNHLLSHLGKALNLN